MARSFKNFLGLFLLLCAGCAPKPPYPPVVAPSTSFIISMQFTPSYPRQMDPTYLKAQVHDITGNPVKDANVIAYLTMPTMDMGKNEVSLKPDGTGFYTGTGRFTMPGDWQVTVNAARKKEITQNYFAVIVK